MAAAALCCCAGFSLGVVGGGCSLVAVPGLLIVVASLVAEHSLWGMRASVAAPPGLSSCGSWALEHGSIVVALVAPRHVGSSQIRD